MRVRILTKSANIQANAVSSFDEFYEGSKSSLMGTATDGLVYRLPLHQHT